MGMTDMAYIISRTLEHKIAIAENNDQNTMLVTLDVLKEILAMLKEKEAKVPSIMQDAEGIWATCPTCGNKLRAILAMEMDTYFPKYCQECGQAVKWNTLEIVNTEEPKPATFEDFGYAQVVRCKDCKYWKDNCCYNRIIPCPQPDASWFCADGERRNK